MTALTLILTLGLFWTAATLTLQGKWSLQSVQQQNVSIAASIDQYVFRSSLIMNRISFSTCNSLSYQISIDQQNFWVNIDSQLINNNDGCSQKDIAVTQLIRQSIRSVLRFDIFINKLYLYSPYSDLIMVFERLKANSQSQKINNGTWSVKISSNVDTNYVIFVNNFTIMACNGTVIYKISIASPFSIKFQLQSGSCESKEVTQMFQTAAFYRKYNQKLQLYDSKVNLIASGIFNHDFNAFNTSSTNLSDNKPSIPQPVNQNPPLQTSLTAGNYILLLLYRRDLMRVRLQITASLIQLTLCTKMVFNYSLTPPSGITISSAITPSKQCSKVDESIYYNYIISAVSYSVDPDGLITLTDNSSKNIISLVLQ